MDSNPVCASWDTVNSMTERSLSTLYRRMRSEAASAAPDLMDAGTLVAASAGRLKGDRRDEVAALLSRSPLHTDLVRLLRELEPDAANLVEALGDRPALGHSRSGRDQRHADPARRHARRLRWVGLAACLMLVFGALVWQPELRRSTPESDTQALNRPDRIFTSEDEIFSVVDDRVPQDAVDNLFRADFNGG